MYVLLLVGVNRLLIGIPSGKHRGVSGLHGVLLRLGWKACDIGGNGGLFGRR